MSNKKESKWSVIKPWIIGLSVVGLAIYAMAVHEEKPVELVKSKSQATRNGN